MLLAEKPGVYRGACAEFCGTSHALMAFDVVVMEPAAFAAWLEREAAGRALPAAVKPLIGNGCGACRHGAGHRGQGRHRAGPHPCRRAALARRRRPADTRENLIRFITEAEAVKPGVRMPSFHALPPAEVAVIAGYLGSLEMSPGARTRNVGGRRRRGCARAGLSSGWRYFSNVNNQAVGVWHTAASFGFFLFAGALALIMRAQLAVPDNDLVSAGIYNQLYTLHGTVMMFLFAVPIFEAVAILILPQMLGDARTSPFPRLVRLRLLVLHHRRRVRLPVRIFFDAAPTAAGSCIRRSPPSGDRRASAPISGCSGFPSSRSPRSPRPWS